MLEITISQLLDAVNGRLISGDMEGQIKGVSIDSRTLRCGDLFFALRGEKHDGHDYVHSALQRGASGAVISRELQDIPGMDQYIGVGASTAGPCMIRVSDTLKALQLLAQYIRKQLDILTIGVTGSTGKTTTKDMIAAILGTRFNVIKNEANFNNEIGLPLTLLRLDRATDCCVVEMGMRGLGEIRALAEIACPKVGVVTNVGLTHLELLGSIENIARAKSELVESLPHDGFAILNADDPRVLAMRNRTAARVLSYGMSEMADIRAKDVQSAGKAGSIATFVTPLWSGRFRIPMPGVHNVVNALAAAAAAFALGFGAQEVEEGLMNFLPSKMRMEITELPRNIMIINDAYNSSPASLEAALKTQAEFGKGRRRIAVLGDMLELGAASEMAHIEAGRLAAELRVDVLITVGERGRGMAQGYTDAMKSGEFPAFSGNAYSFDVPSDAASMLIRILEPGDVVLVKASRKLHLDEVADSVIRYLKGGDEIG